MFATRSTRPATEKTSVTPGMSAICCPTDGIWPRAALMSTTALTIRRRLPSLELRLPLLPEGRDALVGVGGFARQAEGPALELEAGLERHVEGPQDGVAGEALGDRRAPRHLLGGRERGFDELSGRDAARCETHGRGFLAREHAAGQNDLHRDRLARGAHQALGTSRARNEAEARL